MKNNIFNVGLSNANISKKELCEKIKKFIPDLEIIEKEFVKDPDQRNYIVSNKKIVAKGIAKIDSDSFDESSLLVHKDDLIIL